MSGTIELGLIRQVGKLVHGRLLPTFIANGVCLDAEEITEGSLFVPLNENTQESLLEAAVRKGAAASLWLMGADIPTSIPDDFPIFEVKDYSEALKTMAQSYLADVEPTVIAITGSKNVSLTSELLTTILKKHLKVHNVTTDREGQVALCESLLNMNPATEAVICELYPENTEISLASSLLKPSFSIITSLEEPLTEQLVQIEQGMKASSVLVVDGDDASVNSVWKTDVVKCGMTEDSLFNLVKVEENEQSLSLELSGIHMTFTIPYSTEAIKPALFAIAISVHLGMLAEDIQKALVI